MEEELIGVVCSREKQEIYCLVESRIYKEEFENTQRKKDVIYIKHIDLGRLVTNWNYSNLVELSKSQSHPNP